MTSSSAAARMSFIYMNIDETFCFVVYRLHNYSDVQGH